MQNNELLLSLNYDEGCQHNLFSFETPVYFEVVLVLRYLNKAKSKLQLTHMNAEKQIQVLNLWGAAINKSVKKIFYLLLFSAVGVQVLSLLAYLDRDTNFEL